MDYEEHENDSDSTYCSEAEGAAAFLETDLHTLFKTIHDKILLHIQKQEFFDKTSVKYYLRVLNNIDNQDSLVQVSIEELTKKLQSIARSIDKYEELISRNSNSSIFNNITQDQKLFQPIDALATKANDLCNNIKKLEINDLKQTDHCEFQKYPNEDISDYPNSEKYVCRTTSKDVVADSFSGHEGTAFSYKDVNSNYMTYTNVSKKRKIEDSEIEDLESINCVFADREEKIEFLERRKYVLEAMQKSTIPDISDAKGYIFEDPVIAKAYLDRLNSLIDTFHVTFSENIAKIVGEKERKTNEKKLLKTSCRKDKLPSSEEDLQDLSVLFTRMYQELFEEGKD